MIRLLTGAAAGLTARNLLRRAILAKLQRDLVALNAGDAGPLLRGYADDAVLVFNPGDHRWAGTHTGKPAITRFLADFTRAGVTGELGELWVNGPLWRMTMAVRFDDWADAPDGRRIYANATCLVLRTRWGKIVEQRDYYEDTGRILAFEAELRELGVAPVGATPAPV